VAAGVGDEGLGAVEAHGLSAESPAQNAAG
jgi:hypothetical protein